MWGSRVLTTSSADIEISILIWFFIMTIDFPSWWLWTPMTSSGSMYELPTLIRFMSCLEFYQIFIIGALAQREFAGVSKQGLGAGHDRDAIGGAGFPCLVALPISGE